HGGWLELHGWSNDYVQHFCRNFDLEAKTKRYQNNQDLFCFRWNLYFVSNYLVRHLLSFANYSCSKSRSCKISDDATTYTCRFCHIVSVPDVFSKSETNFPGTGVTKNRFSANCRRSSH